MWKERRQTPKNIELQNMNSSECVQPSHLSSNRWAISRMHCEIFRGSPSLRAVMYGVHCSFGEWRPTTPCCWLMDAVSTPRKPSSDTKITISECSHLKPSTVSRWCVAVCELSTALKRWAV